jgi:hypothetical protein
VTCKQWQSVLGALNQDAEDLLVLEGICIRMGKRVSLLFVSPTQTHKPCNEPNESRAGFKQRPAVEVVSLLDSECTDRLLADCRCWHRKTASSPAASGKLNRSSQKKLPNYSRWSCRIVPPLKSFSCKPLMCSLSSNSARVVSVSPGALPTPIMLALSAGTAICVGVGCDEDTDALPHE